MRVVIGEDEALLRDGLALILEGAGFTIAAAVGDARQLVDVVATEGPGLVITDIRMPPTYVDDGLRAALTIRQAQPETAILVLSQFVNRQYARDLLGDRPSGMGYLLKQRIADVERFCQDARNVASGGTVVDPEVVSVMLARAANASTVFDDFTPRQTEVLAMVAEGRSNAAIARHLKVSERAVVNHVTRVYDKLGLPPCPDDHRRVLAVLRYLDR